MAVSTIYELDMANLFAGDDDPTKSQFMVIETIKLPMLQEKTKEHMPGGGVMGVKIGMRAIEPLEVTFKLRGFNPDVMNKFGLSSPHRHRYTIRGSVRDLREGNSFPVVAVVEGRLVKVAADDFRREDGIAHDYEIAEIMKYQLMWNNQEKYYIDFFAGPIGWRVDGRVAFQQEAAHLGLS
jgi:P2 family phage contractile tail tube protein